MRRALVLAVTVAAVAAAVTTAVAASSQHATPRQVAAAMRSNKTISIAGPQHFCGTNGITCSEPALNWEEYTAGYKRAVAHHAPILPYIGHDEPMIQFYSSRA